MKKITGLIVGVFLTANGAVEVAKDFLIFGNAMRSVSAIGLLSRYQHSHETVVLDGAIHGVKEAGISPRYVLGDFDSLSEDGKLEHALAEAHGYFKEKEKPGDEEVVFEPYISGGLMFVRAASQNFTDLDKGIKFALQNNARSIKLLNVLGGERTDHTFHNLSVLKKFHTQSAPIHIETEKEILQFLRDENISFRGTVGAKLGLFGFPKATAVSTGLVWNLDESYNLELGVQDSSCNVLAAEEVTLTVKGEALLVRPSH